MQWSIQFVSRTQILLKLCTSFARSNENMVIFIKICEGNGQLDIFTEMVHCRCNIFWQSCCRFQIFDVWKCLQSSVCGDISETTNSQIYHKLFLKFTQDDISEDWYLQPLMFSSHQILTMMHTIFVREHNRLIILFLSLELKSKYELFVEWYILSLNVNWCWMINIESKY